MASSAWSTLLKSKNKKKGNKTMVIFTETLAELVRGLSNFELSITEESITITSGGGKKTAQPRSVKAKQIPRNKKSVQPSKEEKAVRVSRGMYKFDGEVHSVKEWAEKYKTTPDVMSHRLMSRRAVPYLIKPKTNLKKG